MWDQLFSALFGAVAVEHDKEEKINRRTLPEATYYNLNPSNELMAIVENASEDIEVLKEAGMHYNDICEKVSNAYPALHITYSLIGICIEALH